MLPGQTVIIGTNIPMPARRTVPSPEVLISWSGGKDSCLALYYLQQESQYHVAALLTTITRDYDRISMHGVRRELLEEQAAALHLPVHHVWIGKDAGNAEYEANLIDAVSRFRDRRI